MREKELKRLGGAVTIQTDVRVICATHRNLVEMVNQRQFRADLFYRLNVFPIELPPLRNRPENISYWCTTLQFIPLLAGNRRHKPSGSRSAVYIRHSV
jgi:transcriptional regulator with GAF, ATPase, and Fis domain